MSRLSRRRVLAGGVVGVGVLAGAAAGVEEGLLPGRSRIYAGLGLNGPDTAPPAVSVGPQVHGRLASQHRRTEVGWTIAYPPGVREADPLAVVVGLHGRFDDHTALFGDRIGLDRYLAAVPQPYAIAAVDGGDTYWHPRASGEDASAMVIEEFLPLLSSGLAASGPTGSGCTATRWAATGSSASPGSWNPAGSLPWSRSARLCGATPPRLHPGRSMIAPTSLPTTWSAGRTTSTASPCGSTADAATASPRSTATTRRLPPRARRRPGRRRPRRPLLATRCPRRARLPRTAPSALKPVGRRRTSVHPGSG